MLGFNYHILPRLFQCNQQQNNCCMLNMLYRWPSDMGDLSNKSQHLWPEVPERGGSGVRGPRGRRPAAHPRTIAFVERRVGSSARGLPALETCRELWEGAACPFLAAFPPSLGTRGGKATRGGCWGDTLGDGALRYLQICRSVCPGNK